MNFPASVNDFKALSGLSRELHLAIGVFDGVHLGHKAVIESAIFSAKRVNGVSGVLTFDPHPSRLFRPEAPTRLIMPIESKTEMLHAMGVDCVIRKHFEAGFAGIPAEDFPAYLKEQLPSLKSIYVGENFRFGKKRSGDISTLIQSANPLGLGVFSIDRIKHNGEPISSTRIRSVLQSGKITEANDLLGYNYALIGPVVRGVQRGRSIGFPTLNFSWQPECLPRFGVYYVRFRKHQSRPWNSGIANFGVKPTVIENQGPNLEVHALKGTELGPEDVVEVEWLQFIRAEKKFDSLVELKNQIRKDTAFARRLVEYG